MFRRKILIVNRAWSYCSWCHVRSRALSL